MTPDSDVLADALFLLSSPGWSWRDLQDAPDELVDTMRIARLKLSQQANRNRADAEARR